jgi:hypothetical protein
MSAAPSIITAMEAPEAFGHLYAGESWRAWRAVLKASFALPLDQGERAQFAELAGGRAPPVQRVKELWIVAGRRAGKDSIASLIATFAAAIEEGHIGRLRPGEKATVACLAADRDQSQIVLNYIRALFRHDDLAGKISRETKLGLELESGVEIVVATNSFRTARGRTILLAILDEVAFYRDENSATPDIETYRAIEPGLATIPEAMIVGISSPYRKAGLLYDKYARHFGKDDDRVLVIRAPSLTLNPTLDPAIVERALEADPEAARAEWLGEFRDDISAFVSREAVEACVAPGVLERAPLSGISYSAFVDPSGGSADSMTLAIGHLEDDLAVVDAVREREPPFSPEDVVGEFAALLRKYRITTVQGDKYAGEWPRERFAVHGITYEPAAKPKSNLYRDLLPSLNSRKVGLLDLPRLTAQLVGLERRTARGGRDSIDHGPGAHDDIANTVAGLVALLGASDFDWTYSWVGTPEEIEAATKADVFDEWRRAAYVRHVFHG